MFLVLLCKSEVVVVVVVVAAAPSVGARAVDVGTVPVVHIPLFWRVVKMQLMYCTKLFLHLLIVAAVVGYVPIQPANNRKYSCFISRTYKYIESTMSIFTLHNSVLCPCEPGSYIETIIFSFTHLDRSK